MPSEQLKKQQANPTEAADKRAAELIISPSMAAVRVVNVADLRSMPDPPHMSALNAILLEQSERIENGDMSRAEAMLAGQSTALQTLFARLTERALMSDEIEHIEAFMKLALRAQSQCRATLETLSVIKNPSVVFAHQANLTTGPQQINNGNLNRACEEKKQIPPNQLSGESHGLQTHTRASGSTSSPDPSLETLGEINGPQNARGQEAVGVARLQRRHPSKSSGDGAMA
jgi:hypothetical protein